MRKIIMKTKKNMTWSQAKRKYPNLKPYGDADRDGVKNKFDCRPFDRRLQDVTLYHGTTQQAGALIKRQGLQVGHGVLNVIFTTPNRELAERYAVKGKGVIVKMVVKDKRVKDRVGRLNNLPDVITFSKSIPKNEVRSVKNV